MHGILISVMLILTIYTNIKYLSIEVPNDECKKTPEGNREDPPKIPSLISACQTVLKMSFGNARDDLKSSVTTKYRMVKLQRVLLAYDLKSNIFNIPINH